MQYKRRRKKKTHIGFTFALALLAITVITVLLDVCHVLAPLDGLVFDQMQTWRTNLQPMEAQVCIVVSPDEKKSDVDFHETLLQELVESGARAIAYVDAEYPAVLRDANKPYSNLFFSSNTYVPDSTKLDEQTQELVGSIDLLPTEFGVYRRHYGERSLGRPSLEWQIAKQLLISESDLPKRKLFDINFRGGPNSLPNVDAAEVVAGNLTKSFFRGKAVLIGKPLLPNDTGIVVPTSGNSVSMSRVQLHGHSLNTLLNQAAIQRPILVGKALCYLLCILTPFFVIHHSPYRRMWWNVSACLSVVIVGSWAALLGANVRLPMAGMLLSQAMAVFVSLAIRFNKTKSTLEHLELGRPGNATESLVDFWKAAGDLVYQFHYSLRLTILELPPGNNYLKVVHSINCDENAIAEERRDFRRAPYCDAADLRQPLELGEGRSLFFKDTEPDECQYVVPLVVTGRVVGFIIAGFQASVARQPEFCAQLQSVADDLAVAADATRKRIEAGGPTGVQLFPEQEQLTRIMADEQRVCSERQRLEEIIEGSSTAAATFDVYGRPLVINRRMRDLLKERGVVLSDVTLLHTVQQLSAHDWNECRVYLRRAFFSQRPETLIVRTTHKTPTDTDDNEGIAVLHIRPLNKLQIKSRSSSGLDSPFEISGIHVEFSNETAWQSVVEDRQRIVRQLCGSMFDSLESMRVSEETDSNDAKDDFDTLLDSAQRDLYECHSFLAQHRELSAQASLPLLLSAVIDSTIVNAQQELESRAIELELDGNDIEVDVIANPQLCAKMLDSLLAMTMRDAKPQSSITLSIDTDEDSVVTIVLQNARLLQYLSTGGGDHNMTSVATDELHNFHRWVAAWGGSLEVVQVIGIGLRVQLRLLRHQWHVDNQDDGSPRLITES